MLHVARNIDVKAVHAHEVIEGNKVPIINLVRGHACYL